jgi:putative membrane protein
MHWLLIAVVTVMIALERSWKGVICAIGIFLLSGLLGLMTLDTNFMIGDAALMPLLSGLFGVSVMLPSLASCGHLPEQNIDDEPIDLRSSAKSLCAGTAAGALTGVIPSIGPSQGTVMAQLVTRSSGAEEFLVAVSSVNTTKALFSFVAIYAIGKARSGAAIAVGEIMDSGGMALALLMGVALFTGGIAALLHLKIGKLASKYMDRFPYRALCIAVLVFMVALTVYYSGVTGLLVLATATAIGMLPALVGVKRTHAMGVIMLPCIIYFAGIKGGLLAALGL